MPKLQAHKNFETYNFSKQLVAACYALTAELPAEEKTNLANYIKSAALAIHFNIAQGVFLKGRKKRKTFIKTALNNLLVLDAATEVLLEVNLATEQQIEAVNNLSATLYGHLTDLQKAK